MLDENHIREIVRDELKIISSQRKTPSNAPHCLDCERAGTVVLGTNFKGWVSSMKKDRKRVLCRDCNRSWSISWNLDDLKK